MRNKKTKKIHRQLLYSLLAIFVIFSGIELSNIKENEKAQIAAVCSQAKVRLVQNTFGATDKKLLAKASFAYDFTMGATLDANNASTPLPLASLTKLMTIRVALKSVSPDALYRVIPDDLTSEASIGFSVGDEYPVHELLKAALIDSSNNAAVMISHSTGLTTPTFLADMNSEAKTLRLSTLSYQSVTGLDIDNDSVATAFGSAHDILMLLDKDYADHSSVMAYGTEPTDTIYSASGASIPLVNTDKAIPELPLLVAGKTGYTDTAGGNLAVLWKEPSGHLLGASVLGSTEDGRFADMIRIHAAADIFVSTTESLSKLCDIQ